MQRYLLILPVLTLCAVTLRADNADDAAFFVTTENVEVREMTPTAIQLRSEHNTYCVKLEPNRSGNVIFSLSGIGYLSNVKVKDLAFQVEITGYSGDRKIVPMFSLDDMNTGIYADKNVIRFQRIQGSIPVWFDEEVDSIKLEYSNSHNLNVHQYLQIEDLKILDAADIAVNPPFMPCGERRIMIAVDGSSSIEAGERRHVGRQLIKFARKNDIDSNRISVVEYGTEVLATTSSSEKAVLVDAIKTYKRGKYRDQRDAKWTNWSAAFDEAIERRPDLFILITDGWSNWQDGQPITFTAAFRSLIEKSNTLKANGTRLLFITAGMNTYNSSQSILNNFLNSRFTREESDVTLSPDVDLSSVDLVTLGRFADMDLVPFGSLLQCHEMEAGDLATVE